MRRLPVLWLSLALAVLITNRCVIAPTTRSQLQQIIVLILFEDKLYDDLLSERVILDAKTDCLPPRVAEAVENLNNVDPLVSLRALIPPDQYYSGDNLDLSLTIVKKSLKCLMYKRVAFHLALIIGLIQNPEGGSHVEMRLRVFTHAIPLYINMLSSITTDFEDLLNVYRTVHSIFSSPTMPENAVENLKKQLTSLNDIIKLSCVANEMKLYCTSFNLKKLKNCVDHITDENTVKDLDVNISVDTLMENENAILNFYEEMDLLRGMDMGAWKVFLLVPDLPSTFIRTPLPKFRDEMEKIIYTREIAVEEEEKLAKKPSGESDGAILVKRAQG